MAKWYAWSECRNGGKTKEIQLPQGGTRTVLESRNSIAYGQEITKAKLGVDDDAWNRLIEIGSIRDYPPPEGTDEYTSASQAFERLYVNKQGDLDMNKLMELGLAHPTPVNPPASEAPAGA